jgi:hypothetical protein
VPATHRRAVSLDAGTRALTVVDTVHTFEQVPVRLSWHLGPDVAAVLDGSLARLSWRAGNEQREASLTLPAELRWTAHRGEEHPIQGWYSPGFGRRIPATSLIGQGTAAASTPLVTCLTLA